MILWLGFSVLDNFYICTQVKKIQKFIEKYFIFVQQDFYALPERLSELQNKK